MAALASTVPSDEFIVDTNGCAWPVARTYESDRWHGLGTREFDNPALFAAYVNTLRWNCVTATDATLLQAPFRAGIKIEDYQLEPLRKALRLPRVNLFIADDVGLGKTIEAGLIARELLLRKKAREIVVSCPPSMLQQWQEELEWRFGLRFEILDREYVAKVRRERGFGVNPWTTHPRLLVSHRLLIDDSYTATLRDWLGTFMPGTLFILDEAHHAAPASGQLARYAIDTKITKAIPRSGSSFSFRAPAFPLCDAPQRPLEQFFVTAVAAGQPALYARRSRESETDRAGAGAATEGGSSEHPRRLSRKARGADRCQRPAGRSSRASVSDDARNGRVGAINLWLVNAARTANHRFIESAARKSSSCFQPEIIVLPKKCRGALAMALALATRKSRQPVDIKIPSLVARQSRAERKAVGKALRDKCPRVSHALWKPPHDRPDPVRLVLKADEGRLCDLLPLRHGRMVLSPFTFYRGSALAMAVDLAGTPATGVQVQCGGDSHLVNFRGLATPERQVIFAINDLDETLPAPWEWDLKRLAASFVIACRDNGLPESVARDAALSCVRSYRDHMAEFSEMKVLDLWYFAVEVEMLIAGVKDAGIRHSAIRNLAKARESSTSEGLFPKLVDDSGGSPIIRDQLPAIFHWKGHSPGEVHPDVMQIFAGYRESLAPHSRILLDRYELKDAAFKAVGVGSVGTVCSVVLMTAGTGDPLILQFKEARASVLEAFAERSVFPNHGQRVVNGHRLMQPASDIFLGWTQGRLGRHFYVRQLRDVKIKFAVETFEAARMILFAEWCGYSLALSHARSGDAAMISGYLGKSDTFDNAIAAFSITYADQNEKDHAALNRAIRNGKVKAVIEKAE